MRFPTHWQQFVCALACLLALLGGCGERRPDLAAPKSLQSGNFVFEYPQNWTITHDAVAPDLHSLIIETTGDGIAILQAVASSEPHDLAAYAKSFSDQASAEMPIGNVSATSHTPLPAAKSFEWVQENFFITVLGESVPH